MDTKLAAGASVAGVVGVVLGMWFSPAPGPDAETVVEMLRKELASATGALDGRIDGLSSEVAGALNGLGSRLDGIETGLGGGLTAADLDGLAARIDAVQAEFADAVGALGSQSETQAAKLTGELSALKASLAEAAEAAVKAAQVAPPAAAPEAAPEAVAEAPAAQPVASGLGAGETAMFGNGGLRLFVSRVTDEGARLSMAGEMVQMAPGETRVAMAGREFCEVTLDGVSGGRAEISGACGDDLPEPEGLAVGETAIFMDGKLRAFVSRVETLEERARVSLNGRSAVLGKGQVALADLGDDLCGVTLDGVTRGRVQLGAACGAELGLSEPVGPGATAVLGDGAVRVFVSEMGTDAVRVKMSGQKELHRMRAGEAVAAGEGCQVTLAGVGSKGARFRHECAN